MTHLGTVIAYTVLFTLTFGAAAIVGYVVVSAGQR